ncbi:hypothetical protein [Enterovibrio nigricans]|uniref:Uncharacterized protein n=1 Tax=Enterovibrio nigricans DSM 22720 TaxID=1121868 RepID=A0A1T4VW80_9GAMM|nr:hypothetical protein [Enterovibrio nigricans]PKF49277.1 hypothetical protein AT251_20015 [Enterovibrio nigricans]SKA69159.1 hypothetical protein SAMN02745132_04411 [Enterovibrio nigricans DSM 22720]
MPHNALRTTFNDLLQGFAFDGEARTHSLDAMPAAVTYRHCADMAELLQITKAFAKAAYRLGDADAALHFLDAGALLTREECLPEPLPLPTVRP